ncbi:MAG: cell division protein FtsL [Elusimicrobiota bacterium]
MLKNILYFALFVSILVTVVWTQVESVRLGNDVSSICKRIANVENNNKYLRIQLDELRDPGRIEKIAKEKFGMIEPKGSEVVILKLKSK